MLWKTVENHPELVFQERSEHELVSDVDPLFNDEAIIQFIRYGREDFRFNNGHNKINFSSFLAEIKDVFVEPTFFIVIKKFNRIISESVEFDWYRISIKRFAKKLFLLKYTTIEEAVLLNAHSGLNVFHFYNDVLVKIWFAKKKYTDKPFLISESLYSSALFQFCLSFEFVKKIDWLVVKKDSFLFVKKLVLIKAPQYSCEYFKFVVNQTAIKSNFTHGRKLRIFINRKESSGRTISNFKNLETVLVQNHFIILYLEDYSVPKQIEFFSKANFIIGLHGAGLTNIIFSYKNNPVVIEIAPSDFIPTHYYWISQSLGLRYKLFLGDEISSSKAANSFSIDVDRFSKILSTHSEKIDV